MREKSQFCQLISVLQLLPPFHKSCSLLLKCSFLCVLPGKFLTPAFHLSITYLEKLCSDTGHSFHSHHNPIILIISLNVSYNTYRFAYMIICLDVCLLYLHACFIYCYCSQDITQCTQAINKQLVFLSWNIFGHLL